MQKTQTQKKEAQAKHQARIVLDKEVKISCINYKKEYVNQLTTEEERATYMGDI